MLDLKNKYDIKHVYMGCLHCKLCMKCLVPYFFLRPPFSNMVVIKNTVNGNTNLISKFQVENGIPGLLYIGILFYFQPNHLDGRTTKQLY